MSYLTPAQIKTEIDSIRTNQSGRTIYAVHSYQTDCPLCELDDVKNVSKDPLCNQCGGLGRVTSEVRHAVTAKVRWGAVEDDITRIGIDQKGNASITVSIDDETIMDGATYFDVDDRKVCSYDKKRKGSPAVNRLLYLCKEEGVTG